MHADSCQVSTVGVPKLPNCKSAVSSRQAGNGLPQASRNLRLQAPAEEVRFKHQPGSMAQKKHVHFKQKTCTLLMYASSTSQGEWHKKKHYKNKQASPVYSIFINLSFFYIKNEEYL